MTNIILFGFKGSGKTHIGKQLAKALERPFIDTDDLICQLFGKSPVREVYRALGEEAFRKLESKALFSLKEVQNSIIAVGGGAVLCEDNVLFLRTLGELIYLDTSLETIKLRLLNDKTPAFTRSLEETYHQRKPIYERIARGL